MQTRIETIINEVKNFSIKSREELDSFKIHFSSRKGILGVILDEFKLLDKEEKIKMGRYINSLKEEVENKIEEAQSLIVQGKEGNLRRFDKSKPQYPILMGSRNPVSIVLKEVVDIFYYLGFVVSQGPEIEDDWHNFSALNFDENHPAREMQDTFFIDKDFTLRTHTSSVQVREMEKGKLPIRTISPGRVYRNEAISSRSHCFFHQIEGLCIDEDISFADLKQTLFTFVKRFFGEKTKVRYRPSYFPFTEPSAEMDVFLGIENDDDYRITKGTGWLEILGCGMVDPQVLINCKIDTDKYNGYAFGLGIDRISMYKYGITDIRELSENDVRFLKQFTKV
jgi:phenylalanyl-tRNA synthetase alpha chain